MKLELSIVDTSWPNTKELTVNWWDGVSEGYKQMRTQFVNDIIPKECIKAQLKENLMQVIGDAIEAYIDKALDDKEN